MRHVLLLLALGTTSTLLACTGEQGPAGRDGVAATSVNGITPARGFLGRKVTLTISGFGTNWSSAAKPAVDFGDPEITVSPDDVTVASPTALVVVANIGVNAKSEKKKITVGKDVYEGFSVESPLEVVAQGVVAQGSIVKVTLKNRDIAENVFDDTSVSPGLFQPPEFTNLAIEPQAGGKLSEQVRVIVQNVTFAKAEAILLSDVTIPAESLDMLVKSGPEGNTLDFSAPASFKIEARTATALTPGMTASVDFAVPYNSSLFSFTPAAGDTLNFVGLAGSPASGASPSLYRLPANGSFQELMGDGYFIGTGAEKSYAVAWDGSGTGKYKMQVRSSSTPAAVLSEPTDNDSTATALAVASFPSIMKTGTLSSETDVDYFKVDVPAGKKLVFGTLPGSEGCDTVVAVLAADGTTPVGDPSDDNYHETVTTAALTAGTYYVKVSAGQSYTASQRNYSAFITVE